MHTRRFPRECAAGTLTERIKRTENVRRNGKNVALMGRIGPLLTALCQLLLGIKVVVTFF